METLFYIFLLGLFVILISIPFAIWDNKKQKRKLEEVFNGRESLDERIFYERYFESQGIPFYITKKVREILEDVLDADLSRLSAEDDFSTNLNFFWQSDSLADVEMFERIEEEFDIKFHPSDFKHIETTTIRDIVNIVWKKEQEKSS